MGSLGSGSASVEVKITPHWTSYVYTKTDGTLCYYNVDCAPGSSAVCGANPITTSVPSGGCLKPYMDLMYFDAVGGGVNIKCARPEDASFAMSTPDTCR
jgi:hypothetical protein